VILLLVLCSALVNGETISAVNSVRAEQSNDLQVSQSIEASASQTSQQANPQTSAGGEPPSGSSDQVKESSQREQTKRILGVVPNFAAVTAGIQLPPLTIREKFKLASEDSFDYSSFVWTGILAAQTMALKTYPEFGHGMAAYGRYYWHGFVDGVSGTFFTEAIVPVITHEDPRYFTLGHGGFFRRLAFALSRTVVTKTDSGGLSFNISEIGGNAMEAGLANLYYPSQERGLRKTAENWGGQMEGAVLNNIVKEFWPDIRHYILRRK
jgi:hypothetical protein